MNYKFLNSGDVDKVLVGGTMMVSSLDYFRKLEETAGDIGDRLEGASEVTIRNMTVTAGSPELAMLNAANIGLGLFEQFAKIEVGGQINIAGRVNCIHVAPTAYIYSLSVGELGALTEEMCVKAPLPYDACLQIKDPIELCRACMTQATIENMDGCRMSELFVRADIGNVEYVARSIDFTEGGAMTPDPFKKAERFRHQSELRFVFLPHDGKKMSEQRLVLRLPDPSAHFELIFRDRA